MSKKDTIKIDARPKVNGKHTILGLDNFVEVYTKEALDKMSFSVPTHPDDDVESVSGTLVDTTDPRNPIVNKDPQTAVNTADIAILKPLSHPDDDVETITGSANLDVTDPRNPVLRFQTALETLTSITGNTIIADNSDVQTALLALAFSVSGVQHTQIVDIDFKPTGNPNEYTIEVTWLDSDGNTQVTQDATPVTFTPQVASEVPVTPAGNLTSTDTQAALEELQGDIDTLTTVTHTHANKALLDTYTQTDADIADAIAKAHEHLNKALLDTYTQTEVDLADAVLKKHDIQDLNQNVLTGDINVTVKSTPTIVKLKSADANNNLQVGTDGGLFYQVAPQGDNTKDEFTGVTGTALTLSATPVVGTITKVYKNSALLFSNLYALAGTSLTMSTALLATDQVIVIYTA